MKNTFERKKKKSVKIVEKNLCFERKFSKIYLQYFENKNCIGDKY